VGNRVTAVRWARILRGLGHRASIGEAPGTHGWDVLVALHARKSAAAVEASKRLHPERRVVVALTGTDLYRDIHSDASARRALALADRLIVLHARATEELPAELRGKARLVPQSASATTRPRRSPRTFEVAVVGHLRAEKDPLRTARAARLLPPDSRIRVIHAGRALEPAFGAAARREQRENARYTWLEEVSPARARSLIGRARLLSLTSNLEGGANVVSEALAADTPVVAARIPCTEALLGGDYPGLFPVGDTRALAELLARAEREPRFLAELARRCRLRRAVVSPAKERAAWRALLRELGVSPDRTGR
jgi:putative glycosyltransferase (TIGR04348 family)